MYSVEEALALVIDRCQPMSAVEIPVDDALGLVLAANVVSQLDVPPYDKALMDGYALSHKEWSPHRKFKVIGRVTAGSIFPHPLEEESAVQIMTGAPIPAGADCVVMFEQTTEFDTDGHPWVKAANADLPASVVINVQPREQQHIMPRALVMNSHEVILASGRKLRPIDIGLAIESGNCSVQVIPKAKIAVLATGDELISAAGSLEPGQIYNSNSPMIAAFSRQAGAEVNNLGIARDQPGPLREAIAVGLQSDILILTGGVSEGVLDLVPATLKALGVEQVFHKVQLKPGKPVWFGTKHRPDGRQMLVFGLPGNPVSSFVCFFLFVYPAIHVLAGLGKASSKDSAVAKLVVKHVQRGNRPTYWPAVQTGSGENARIEPLAWQGSADMRALAQANSLAIFPAGDRDFQPGESIRFVALP